MIIRQENSNDYKEVYNLVTEAFKSAEYAAGNEQNLVVALRKGDAFISELSLVAEINNKIVGHIMFTKAKIGQNSVLVLAPLSVKPQYQKQGVGTAFIIEGHKIARKCNHNL